MMGIWPRMNNNNWIPLLERTVNKNEHGWAFDAVVVWYVISNVKMCGMTQQIKERTPWLVDTNILLQYYIATRPPGVSFFSFSYFCFIAIGDEVGTWFTYWLYFTLASVRWANKKLQVERFPIIGSFFRRPGFITNTPDFVTSLCKQHPRSVFLIWRGRNTLENLFIFCGVWWELKMCCSLLHKKFYLWISCFKCLKDPATFSTLFWKEYIGIWHHYILQ